MARAHKVSAWNQRHNLPATKFIPVGGKDWASAQPVSLDYWRYLSQVIQPEPVEPRDKVMMGMLVHQGLVATVSASATTTPLGGLHRHRWSRRSFDNLALLLVEFEANAEAGR